VKNGDGSYTFSSGSTGLAIDWGDGNDVVVFLQGGGACWDFITCGGAASLDAALAPVATTGPSGPAEFQANFYAAYPGSWIRRVNLPAALAHATVVFVPYCTGDVHGGARDTTYRQPPYPGLSLPPVTWRHRGHENVMAFLKRLGATFALGPEDRLVVAGSSAGGFGALANYPAFRWYWPDAKAYLVDDSGPPLAGNAIPASSRAAWYASWNLGASLGAFCPDCPNDMSAGIRELNQRYPADRKALLSHLQDETIRTFFGTLTLAPAPALVPMDAGAFEAALRALGAANLAPPSTTAAYFYASGTEHPMLVPDPSAIATPPPGLPAWMEQMLSDDLAWASAAPPATAAPEPLAVEAR